jgi:hypothetical protein
VVVSSFCPRTTSTKSTPPTLDYSSSSPSPVLSRSPYSDLSPCSVFLVSSFYSLCLYPSATIMDAFFSWTAAALTIYLVGCDLVENAVPPSDGTHVPSQGTSVRFLARSVD